MHFYFQIKLHDHKHCNILLTAQNVQQSCLFVASCGIHLTAEL